FTGTSGTREHMTVFRFLQERFGATVDQTRHADHAFRERRSRSTRTARRIPLRLEPLEDRNLMSGAGVSNSVLNIMGDDGPDDVIEVSTPDFMQAIVKISDRSTGTVKYGPTSFLLS